MNNLDEQDQNSPQENVENPSQASQNNGADQAFPSGSPVNQNPMNQQDPTSPYTQAPVPPQTQEGTVPQPTTNEVFAQTGAQESQFSVLSPTEGAPLQQNGDSQAEPYAVSAGIANGIPTQGSMGNTMYPQPAPVGMNPNQPNPQKTSTMGIISLVLGIIALLLSWIPGIDVVSIILAIVGIILAIVGLVNISKGKEGGKVLTIIATILNVIAVIISFIMLFAVGSVANSITKDLSSSDSSSSSQSTPSHPKHYSAPKHDTEDKSKTYDTEGDLGGDHVKIVSAARSGNDDEGKPVIIVTYQWTNGDSKNSDFMRAFDDQVFQNGHSLDSTYLFEGPEGYDSNSDTTELQPGASGTVTIAYNVEDDSPVTVELSSSLDYTSESKVTHKFNI